MKDLINNNKKKSKKTRKLIFSDGAAGDNNFNDYSIAQLQRDALLQLNTYLHHQAVFRLNEYLEITETQFYFLAQKLNPIFKAAFEDASCKEYTVEIQLAITLKYLATNEFCFPQSLQSLQKVMANTTYQMCEWLFKSLKEEYVSLPKTNEKWQKFSNRFNQRYNMPFCLGVLSMQRLGSTQVPIRYSRKCSPLIFTCILDADDNFIYADVLRSRALEWNGIFEVSDIRKHILSKKLFFPEGIYGGQANIENLRFFAADNTMPNTTYLLSELHAPGPLWNGKQYIYTQCPPKSLEYNYCQIMSRINVNAKQALNDLQILFPAVNKLWCLDPNKARKVLLGSILLYNFLRTTNNSNRICIDVIANSTPGNLHVRDSPIAFNPLMKQQGDTPAGLSTRNRVAIYMAIRRMYTVPLYQTYNAISEVPAEMGEDEYTSYEEYY